METADNSNGSTSSRKPFTMQDHKARVYQHDHDEELGCYWYDDPPPKPGPKPKQTARVPALVGRRATYVISPAAPRSTPAGFQRLGRPRDAAYWDETASLVLEYFELQVGSLDSEMLVAESIDWLKRSPAERRCCETGDDMARAALVDWFLRIVR